VRVTSRGRGLLVAGVLLLGGGFWFGYPELAALGAACVVSVVGALAFVAWRPRLGVTRSADPDRVMRGNSSELTLSITNASRFFGASLVARDRVTHGSAATPGAPRSGLSGTVAVPVVRLRPGTATRVRYPVPTRRRGLVTVGPLEASRQDPLGLVSVVRRYGPSVQVWVRPRVHPITNVPVGLSRSMDGRVDRVPQGSITFAALREYVVGDDLRQVHWRTSARVGSLMVREHMDTSLPRLVILLDDRASAHDIGPDGESTFEAACEAAASVLATAAHEGVHVELRPLLGRGATARSDIEVGALLDLLAEATLAPPDAPGVPGALAAAVESLRIRRLGDTLVYLGGPPNQEDLGLIAGLRGAYPSIIAGVFGSVESGLATNEGMLVVAAVDGPDFAGAWDGIRAW
jgi:uncharacterized protein (DUF58 family)